MERDCRRNQLAVRRRARRGVTAVAGALVLAALAGVFGAWLGVGEKDGGRALQGEPTTSDEVASEGITVPSDLGFSRRESSLPLEEEAACVLGRRRQEGNCVVARSGYLDLSGRVWGCALQGDGWSEVIVVLEGDGDGCDVLSCRMDAREIDAKAFLGTGG